MNPGGPRGGRRPVPSSASCRPWAARGPGRGRPTPEARRLPALLRRGRASRSMTARASTSESSGRRCGGSGSASSAWHAPGGALGNRLTSTKFAVSERRAPTRLFTKMCWRKGSKRRRARLNSAQPKARKLAAAPSWLAGRPCYSTDINTHFFDFATDSSPRGADCLRHAEKSPRRSQRSPEAGDCNQFTRGAPKPVTLPPNLINASGPVS